MTPSTTCPRCDRTSRHPEDIRYSYCGYCAKFYDKVIRIWRDVTSALWDEFAGGLMSRVDSPNGQDQLVPGNEVHAKHGPLVEVWPAEQTVLFDVQPVRRYEARWSE